MSSITITGTSMSSPVTPHTATATGEGWEVSWLPGRTLDRNQATTAMVIASTVGSRGIGLSSDPIWPHIESWAGELGLSGADAVARVSEPPVLDGPATANAITAQPSNDPRLCAHADRDGQSAHRLAPGQTCEAEPSQEPEAGA